MRSSVGIRKEAIQSISISNPIHYSIIECNAFNNGIIEFFFLHTKPILSLSLLCNIYKGSDIKHGALYGGISNGIKHNKLLLTTTIRY